MHNVLSFLAILLLFVSIKRGIVPNIISAPLFLSALIWKVVVPTSGAEWVDYLFIGSQAFCLFCTGMMIGVKVQSKNDRKIFDEAFCNMNKFIDTLLSGQSAACTNGRTAPSEQLDLAPNTKESDDC